MEIYPLDIAIHIVNIVVFYVLIRAILFKPVQKFLSQRTERVQGEMAAAEKATAEAQELKRSYEQQLSAAQKTCDEIVSSGKAEAVKAAEKLIDDARSEADAIVSAANAEASQRAQRAINNVRLDVASLGAEMAGRILRFDDDIKYHVMKGDTRKIGQRHGVLKLPAPCDQSEVAGIASYMEDLLGCNLHLNVETDPSIEGGFAVYVDGQIYDFTYPTQLHELRRQLSR